MENLLFVAALAVVYAVVIRWACRSLPDEKWQVAAAVPLVKNGGGEWSGLNITYYGVFQATSFLVGIAFLLVMMGSVDVPLTKTVLFLAPMLAVCVPAARWVARLVEKKPQTLTVAGASFVGLLMSPWLVLLIRLALGEKAGDGFQIIPIMAAITVGYAAGEGIGRLACISFGCCYGKPLCDCHPNVRRIFGKGFVFTGETKKIAYESGYDGQPVVPIQAVTSGVLVGTALLGLFMFLNGWFTLSFVVVLTVTQGWRAFSETLRADYRGGGKLSAYQKMAVVAIVYGSIIALSFPVEGAASPDLYAGLNCLWSPWVLIGLEGLWFAVLWYVGRSKVTGSTIRFHVVRDQV